MNTRQDAFQLGFYTVLYHHAPKGMEKNAFDIGSLILGGIGLTGASFMVPTTIGNHLGQSFYNILSTAYDDEELLRKKYIAERLQQYAKALEQGYLNEEIEKVVKNSPGSKSKSKSK